MDVFLTGFKIKRLVAILLLLLMMASSEAGPVRIRHNRKNIDNCRRHVNLVPKNQTIQPLQSNSLYKKETRKIKQKLEQVLKEFTERYKKINLSKTERSGNPSWLPKVNFVSIHSFTNNVTRYTKRRFRYVLPKLYLNLYNFKLMLQRLLQVKSVNDDCDREYGKHFFNIDEKLIQRKSLLNFTISEINMVMVIINDAIERLGYTRINLNCNVNLSQIEIKVDTTKCLQQDLPAFRSYERTMRNWISEFECWFPPNENRLKNRRMKTRNQACTQYEERLKNRRRNIRNQA